MNILYICHRIPYPPDKGDKIRSYHQVVELSRRHRVHVACLVDAREDFVHVEALRKKCASVDAAPRGALGSAIRAALALLTGESLSVAAFRSSALRRAIEKRTERDRPDAVVVFSSAMAPYASGWNGTPRVLDLVDVDSEKWRDMAAHASFPLSWIYRIEAGRLAREEARYAARFDRAILVSDLEAALFRERGGEGSIQVLVSGVDLDYYTPRPPRGPEEGGCRIVFVGVMDYWPNVDAVATFCDHVLPRIAEVIPDATFTIVGRNPVRRVRDLARRPGVTVTGTVPDVRPHLADATVAVAPFRVARGVQNKVLEAMASGVPVVSTRLGVQGVRLGPEDGVIVADDPGDQAREIVTLAQDRATWTRRSAEGRRFVERFHRWDDHGAALNRLLEEIHRPNAEGALAAASRGGGS
jgi:sugar transferase (PEP-CTERM/EpsH1 system associated)